MDAKLTRGGLQWLILCINMARLLCPTISNITQDAVVKLFFKSVIKSLDWVKEMTFHNMRELYPAS